MTKLATLFLASRSRGAGRYLLARRAGGWWGLLAAAVLPVAWRYARRRHGHGATRHGHALGDRGSGALDAAMRRA